MRLVALISFLIVQNISASEIPAVLLDKFQPLPETMTSASNPMTEAKLNLGRMLFFEPRISRDQKVSCNSCHDLAKYGVDGAATSTGFQGQRGNRNAPTVYNAAGHFVQFWDGRAATVEIQAAGPILNPVEMAAPSPAYVVTVLKSMPDYVEAFQKAFPGTPDPVTFNNTALAIAAFERKLLTPSRWDQYLRGDKSVLTDAEKQGFVTFSQKECDRCHTGSLLGGHEFRKLGVKKNWPNQSDIGREKVTGNKDDKLMFKVPSLRNVAKTAPYLHNGEIVSLETVVMKMAEYQSGKKITKAEVDSIVAWLNTLTGTIPTEYVRPPALPASTERTPKPL